MSRILVLLQVILSAAIVITARLSLQHVAGFAVAATGVAIGAWAVATIGPRQVSVLPDVDVDAQLKTSGPYRFVRHPMYSALLLACLGLAFSPYATWKILTACGLAIVLTIKAAIEEQQLRKTFADYGAYANTTKRFIPKVW